jgi:hypothetical protein
VQFSHFFSQVLILFSLFLHIISIPGFLLYLLYSFQFILTLRIVGLFWNILLRYIMNGFAYIVY